MTSSATLIVLLGAIASVLSILVGTVTIGKTLVAIANSFNASSNQLNNAICALTGQMQLHVTEAQGRFEMLEYKIHGLDEKINHKSQRFERELEKIKQLEGWAATNHNYKIRNNNDGQLQ